ncbi:DJ-1/PfpI family protein-like protein [Cucurbitaria berberidis CBS 394.84]|uniref:DJ-1/PfpI family protein-like protein n=1 Tax=Cucurbitaria berberidis CBS 394.84 TaxID=1168544 RepID=A0A9P4G6W9_9PLEO|nr:DJ-1/PfpI family protein-like protein [Cucurbitaria berberidis CBS 394.84]KAF1840153.1 DJ-1/PfpI family protein-like protein [Cucurbitaria berberidis CBS 394.84]
MTSTNPLPTKIGIIIFPGFQLLDYAGPLDALNILSATHTLRLYTIASTLSPVPTQNAVQTSQGSTFSQSILPTHTFATAPKDLDVLILPGGLGSRSGEGNDAYMRPQVEYLKGLDLSGKGSVKFVLTVCTGSEILARTGVLDGRRATTNKKAFNEVKAWHPQVNWVAKARWVVDGNIWTSSGISAGMDLAFAWIAEVFGEETAQFIADRSEYERNVESGNDRYAERWGAV